MSPYDLIHLICEPKTPWIVSLLYFGTKAFCALLTYRKNTLILRQRHIERMASLEKGPRDVKYVLSPQVAPKPAPPSLSTHAPPTTHSVHSAQRQRTAQAVVRKFR